MRAAVTAGSERARTSHRRVTAVSIALAGLVLGSSPASSALPSDGRTAGTALYAQVPAPPHVAAPTAAGALDPSFDDDGVALPPVDGQVTVVDSAVQPQPDGDEAILVLVDVLVEYPGDDWDEGAPLPQQLWRLLPDGALDLSFDDDGVVPVSSSFASPDAFSYRATQVAAAADGSILLAGHVDDGEGFEPGVRRLGADGTVDAEFGTDGDLLANPESVDGTPFESPWPPSCHQRTGRVAQESFDLDDVADAAGDPVGGDGAVVVAFTGNGDRYDVDDGTCSESGDVPAAVVMRYDEDGFAGGGVGALPGDLQDNPAIRAAGLVVAGDRVVVTAGGALGDGQPGEEQVVVMQFRSAPGEQRDLGLDPAFGDEWIDAGVSGRHGIATHDRDVEDETAIPVAVMADGGVLVAVDLPDAEWLVLRWAPDASAPPDEEAFLARDSEDRPASVGDMAVSAGGEEAALVGPVDLNAAPGHGTDFALVARLAASGERLDFIRIVEPRTGPLHLTRRIEPLRDGSTRVIGDLITPLVAVNHDHDVPEFVQRAATMIRLDPTADLDLEFGPQDVGYAAHTGGGRAGATGVGVTSDLRIDVGGRMPHGLDADIGDYGFVAMLEEYGIGEEEWPADTRVTVEVPPFNARGRVESLAVEGLVVDGDDRPTVAGASTSLFTGNGEREITVDGGGVARLEAATPTFDPSFTTGPVAFLLGVVLHDVTTVPDGAGGHSILAVGERLTADVGNVRHLVVVKMRDGGVLDPAFGDGGILDLALPAPSDTIVVDTGRGIDVDAEGRIVVTGWRTVSPDIDIRAPGNGAPAEDIGDHLLVARLAQDEKGEWTWDPAFGSDPVTPGVVAGPLGHRGHDLVADGSEIVVVGDRDPTTEEGLPDDQIAAVMLRFAQDGSPDAAFGDGGELLPFGAAKAEPSHARAVALDADNDLVVVGTMLGDIEPVPPFDPPFGLVLDFGDADPVRPDIAVARVSAAGVADGSFGVDGIVTTDMGLAAAEYAEDVDIAPGGKIVVAGHVTDQRSTRPLVARYLPETPALICLPDPADAGIVQVGSTATATVTCVAQDGRVRVDSLAVDPASQDADAFDVASETCVGQFLSPGDECEVEVEFTALAVGDHLAGLRFEGRSVLEEFQGEFEVVVGLRGTGEVDVTRDGPGFVAVPDPLAFGAHRPTAVAPADTVTVTSVGEEPLEVTAIELAGPSAGDFDIVGSDCLDAPLEAGGTCEVRVQYAPGLNGPTVRRASLAFTHNATTSPDDVALRGRIARPSIALDPEEGPVETEVAVTGEGYASNTSVRLRLRGDLLATVPADQLDGGTFEAGVTIPEGTPGGPWRIRACQRCDSSFPHSASEVFLVTPRLFASPAVTPTGSVVQVLGDGFVPDEQVTLSWSEGLGARVVVPDELGEFRMPVVVFHRDVRGARLVHAVVDPDAEEPAATAQVLVVPGSAQPGEFAVRR